MPGPTTKPALQAAADLQRMRFKVAVDHMAQGLCMFDAEQKLVICNEQYGRIYDLPPDLLKPGTPHDDILDYRIAHGMQWPGGAVAFWKRNETRLNNRDAGVETVTLRDGRIIEIRHQPMIDGGWVATHSDITVQRESEARIRHLANHDPLTDLPNRARFQECVDEVEGRTGKGESVALLCIDLDHFKTINDSLGHLFGDELLKGVAARLRASCRDTDVVARLGGDEFAILQSGLTDRGDAADLAQRIVRAIGEPFDIRGHQVMAGASIGIAIAPDDGMSAEMLMRHADLALYRAKDSGRESFRFYEKGMNLALTRRLALAKDLDLAMARDQLSIVFQPLIRVADGSIGAFEALLRWHHPVRGTIPTSEVIEVAEETGQIAEIGRWVMREAFRAAAYWPEHVRIAVNLSPSQFASRTLVADVEQAIADAQIAASRIELEVTESTMLARNAWTLEALYRLKSMGLRLSIDDFGTGYASLSYLRYFHFDKVKIDQSFIAEAVSSPENLAIVRAIIGLGHSLGFETAAEGVETDQQLQMIRREGATEAQGFLFGMPVPVSGVNQLLDHWGAGTRGRVTRATGT